MRRRIKPRVVWLPQTNANSFGDLSTVYQAFPLPIVGNTGVSAVVELPMVLDNQATAAGVADVTLADINSSGYRLRRIVGKLWLSYSQTGSAEEPPPVQVIVTAGFIIRKANPATGFSLASTVDADLINPGKIENSGDPWIWRRSWTLANRLNLGTDPEVSPFPGSNFGANGGSVADGPHIDQKTARIVGQEERLFLSVSATVFEQSIDNQAVGIVTICTDVRCLASMRTTTGNRRNASR